MYKNNVIQFPAGRVRQNKTACEIKNDLQSISEYLCEIAPRTGLDAWVQAIALEIQEVVREM